MNHSLLESKETTPVHAVPYITMESDLMYKLETAFTNEKPLLILFQTPFGDHQFSGYITEISFHDQWINIENGVLAKRVSIDQILLVVEWS
jgi:hypothetical protein